jgi:tetratricopeptide (TPR) repeat protein
MAPTDASYHNNYALALARARKFDDMQTEIKKAIELDPAGAGKYYFNLGAVLTNNGQTGPACDAFKNAITADPNYADAHYQYGICLTSKATSKADGTIVFPDGTSEAFQKYLELKPDGPFAESAKSLLASMGSKVDTSYTAPGAEKKKPAPAKKK